MSHVRAQFYAHNSLYAPAYLFLYEEAKKPNLPYRLKAPGKTGKGKNVLRHDAELAKEVEWVKLKLQEDAGGTQAEEDGTEDAEDGIECGCCFSTYPFVRASSLSPCTLVPRSNALVTQDKMIQCPEAHLFCTDCMTSYASTLLGGHDANIMCMDQSGCKLLFPESELRRFLSDKLLALYERVKQRKEIEAAELENLEECPFCEYKCVIENEQEKLFRCENQDCLAITCRECKKLVRLYLGLRDVKTVHSYLTMFIGSSAQELSRFACFGFNICRLLILSDRGRG